MQNSTTSVLWISDKPLLTYQTWNVGIVEFRVCKIPQTQYCELLVIQIFGTSDRQHLGSAKTLSSPLLKSPFQNKITAYSLVCFGQANLVCVRETGNREYG